MLTDPIIDAYKKDVDRTMLIENLRLTPQQRFDKFDRFMEGVLELRRAGERHRQLALAAQSQVKNEAYTVQWSAE